MDKIRSRINASAKGFALSVYGESAKMIIYKKDRSQIYKLAFYDKKQRRALFYLLSGTYSNEIKSELFSKEEIKIADEIAQNLKNLSKNTKKKGGYLWI